MELDELNVAREKSERLKANKKFSLDHAFAEFEEAEIDFPPTYKFEAGGKSYSPSRIPSYTV